MRWRGKREKAAASLLALLLVFALTGCGSSETTEAGEESRASESEPAAESAGETEEASADISADLACPSVNGQLQVIGTQLCDQAGDPVQLRGISTHGLAWFPEYVNQDCVNELKDWGANVLRLALYPAESGGYCTDGDQDALKELVKSGVKYATNADMYVIVDWHVLSEGTPTTYQREAADFFDEMSKEFADQDNVLYEICNEPNSADWPEIKAYAEEIIPVIRAHDPNAVILVGTPTWSQEVDKPAADPITDQDHIMYTLHFYAATHQDDLRHTLTAAVEDGLPVFVTEYGLCDASGSGALDLDSANEWIQLLNEYDISYVAWNLSNKDESSSIFSPDVSKISGFTYDDFSASGQWVYDRLQGALNGTAVEEATADVSEEVTKANVGTVTEDGLTVHVILDSSWDDGQGTYSYLYRVTVDNTTGAAISDWNIALDFNEDVTLTDSWNGRYSVNDSTVIITNEEYNGILQDGEPATDVGFILDGTDTLALK